jgi:hypothetical protein
LICSVFAISDLPRAASSAAYLPPAALLLASLGIRFRAHTSRGAAVALAGRAG